MTVPPETASPAASKAEPLPAGISRNDLREILRLFNRRKFHILFTTLAAIAIAAVILAQLTPEYRSTALLMLDTRKAKVTNVSDVLGGLNSDVAAMQTEIEVLKSVSLLGRVVDRLRLEADPEFGAAASSPVRDAIRYVRRLFGDLVGESSQPQRTPLTAEEGARSRAIAALIRNMTISSRGRSYVISVSMDSDDPAKARKIVDAIADTYLVDQLNFKFEANKRATEWLDERLTELKKSVETSERAVASFRERSGLTLAKDATVVTQSLTELNSQLIQARAQRADRESRLVALQQAYRNPAAASSISEVLANPVVSALRAQEAEIGRRIGDLNQRYGESHPRMVQARSEIGQLQGRIAAEIAKIVSAVQADAEAARSKEQQLQAQVTELEKQAGGLGQEETGLRQLEREAQSTRVVYEDFLKRFKELREQQDIQQPDSRVLSPATLPGTPIYPRYALTLGVAAGLGLALAVGLVLLAERLDGGFRTGDQIERVVGRPTVGMIPALSRLTLGSSTPSRFVVERPSSAYAESLRSAYTAIMLGSLDKPPKIIMVTSALPGEGKTTFTTSIAGLLAKSNPDKRILVVDCDLRRSSVAHALNLKDIPGTIDELLSGAKTLENVLIRDKDSGLFIIPARANTPNSAEILESNAMRRLLEQLSEAFDTVFLDTPPAMAVSDARVVASVADYVAFMVRWERTPREIVVNALKLLRDVNRGVGIVLTQVNVRRHSKYGYGDYGYYYSKYRDYYRG